MIVLRGTAAVVALFLALGCSTPAKITSQKEVCGELESEIARAYQLTKFEEARWDAWQQLYKLLETAQLRACEVKTEIAYSPMRSEQVAHFTIGGTDLECIKPSGVRVYAATRDLSKYPDDDVSNQPLLPELRKLRQVLVFSYPPKGPTILIDKTVSQLPNTVQAFLYERACEAHRQGVHLDPNSGAGYSARAEYNCAAIKNLKGAGLTREQLGVILEYARTNEFAPYAFFAREGGKSIQWEEMFNSCFQSESFRP